MFSNVILHINVSLLSNPHIRVICEGLCDAKEWSNDAKNSDLITGINYTYSHRKLMIYIEIIFHYIIGFLYF